MLKASSKGQDQMSPKARGGAWVILLMCGVVAIFVLWSEAVCVHFAGCAVCFSPQALVFEAAAVVLQRWDSSPSHISLAGADAGAGKLLPASG